MSDSLPHVDHTPVQQRDRCSPQDHHPIVPVDQIRQHWPLCYQDTRNKGEGLGTGFFLCRGPSPLSGGGEAVEGVAEHEDGTMVVGE